MFLVVADELQNAIQIELLDGRDILSTEEAFTVIESDAFYEAYHHVLHGLQTLGERHQKFRDPFPFARYLVRYVDSGNKIHVTK